MSDLVDIIEGVQDALAQAGEDGQIIRRTVTLDPANPTRTIIVEKTYDARMYFNEPRSSYIAEGMTVQRNAELYVDLLSLEDTSDQSKPNTIENGVPNFTVITDQDDIAVRADGTRLTLTVNIGTNRNGTPVIGLHEISR